MADSRYSQLTEKQGEALLYVCRYFLTYGFAPTQREILDALKLKGRSANWVIRPLLRLRYLEVGIGGQHRNLVISRRGKSWFSRQLLRTPLTTPVVEQFTPPVRQITLPLDRS